MSFDALSPGGAVATLPTPTTLRAPVGVGVTVLERALSLGGHLDGIGTYTRALVEGLREEDVSIEPWSFPVKGASPRGGMNPSWFKQPFVASAVTSACTGLNFAGSRAFDGRIGLFHATDHLIPKLSVPVLANIMDSIPLMRSNWIKSRFHRQKSWLFRQSTRWADHFLTISEFAADDIAERLNVTRDKVTSIHLGVDERYFEPLSNSIKAECLGRLSLRPDFFLFIGTLQPRKNIGVLIDSFERLPLDTRRACPLVIVGRNGWNADAEIGRLAGLEANGTGRWLNYVNDLDKRALMQSATALVFPSLFEGFGLPVLEAFASGLPVIASKTTSIPEVASNAALLVDPLDAEEIAFSMLRVLNDGGLASDLSSKGRDRARAFTWADTARRTANLYESLLGGRK